MRKELKNGKISKIVSITVGMSLVGALLVGCSDEESKDIIQKLDKGTNVSKSEDRYLFDYGESWEMNYNDAAQTVYINEAKVADCVASFAGVEDIGNDGQFVYNWDKEQYYLYVDYDEDGSDISIISYSVDKEEWSIMVDGEWHEATDDFVNYMSDSNIVSVMEQDINSFKEDLKALGVSIDDLSYISYDDIDDYYSNN